MLSDHAEREGLLADVLAHPDDDAPRLIFADWCEDHGEEERAQFVRLQLELASLPPHFSFAVRQGMHRREEELFDAAWLPHVGGALRQWYYGTVPDGAVQSHPWLFVVRRGFVCEVHATLADLLAHGRDVPEAHPVTRLMASDREPQDYHNNGGAHLWGWLSGPNDSQALERHCLPHEIWRQVSQDGTVHGVWADFHSRAAAIEPLSDAILHALRHPAPPDPKRTARPRRLRK